jgi:ABC-type glycerol-3-phosphate transport system substrate-binding protein
MRCPAPALNLAAAPLHACRRLLPLLAALSLAGCAGRLNPPQLLYLAVGVDADQRIETDLRQTIQERLAVLQKGFRQLHPDTSFQLGIYPEDRLLPAMLRRSRAGLDPDLLLLNGDTALQLLNARLVEPFPASPELLRSFDAATLDRVRNADGQLAGVPVLVQTQLSCFDRRRVPEAPRTLAALLQLSAAGQPVGLSVDPLNLLWTAGSLGAMPALERALRGEPVQPADQAALARWLTWLQSASSQQRVTFFESQPASEAEFLAGRLAWIPCRSISLPLMLRQLGAHLGVAPLPDGPEGQSAAALNRLRVMALGRHSSAAGRQRALAFVHYSVNPLTQRALTTGSLTVLPANRHVSVPVQSSQMLMAMEEATVQGQSAIALMALMRSHDRRIAPLKGLLTGVVFGESSPADGADALLQQLRPRR